jgi:hypothetical protein
LYQGTTLVVPQLLENIAGLEPLRADFLAIFEFSRTLLSPCGGAEYQKSNGKITKPAVD